MATIHFDMIDYIEDLTDSELKEEADSRGLGLASNELEDILIILRSGDNEKLRDHLSELIYEKNGRIV